jgi:hypothetical protein
MYARNVTAQQLKEIAEDWGFVAQTNEEALRVKFTLRNKSDQYHVVTDRAVFRGKVCYHGHYEFLETLFATYPDAIVDANWYKRVRYTSDNFEDLAEEVGDVVVRQFDQLRARDRCNCE